MQRLPLEVICEICAYAPSHRLRLVCHRWWNALPLKRIEIRDEFPTPVMLQLLASYELDSVKLNIGKAALCSPSHLRAFIEAMIGIESLRALSIALHNCALRNEGARWAFEPLGENQMLTSFSLDLWNNSLIQPNATTFLERLFTHANLETLELFLGYNQVGPDGMGWCTRLSEWPRLARLTLDVTDNNVADEGLESLANGLIELPQLQHLTLTLRGNQIGDSGMMHLSKLKACPKLENMTLYLGNNRVGDRGARALVQWFNFPALVSLFVDLRNNQVTNLGARAIGEWSGGSKLNELRLYLGNNRIGEDGAAAVNRLRRVSQLQNLTLVLFAFEDR